MTCQLSAKDVRWLLPTYAQFIRWSDRVHRREAPLFPGYVFVNVSDEERTPVLRTLGVVRLVSSGGKVCVLPDEDIARLRICTGHSSEVEPYPYLNIGHRVRVTHGPFAGWEGILVEKQNATRLVVSVEHIRKSVSINIHGADVEALD